MPVPLPSLAPSRAAAGRDSLEALLAGLYAEQRALTPDSGYLADHARPTVVATQVAVFRWYRRFLPPGGRVLDWGCNHAPDSCLVRAWGGDRYELEACDYGAPERFAAFHRFARLAYTTLAHQYVLPYHDFRYDAVVAAGVLEHAALDYESLKELHRVLKPGGVLVVSYLPNRWSTEEWVRRVIRKRDFHQRLYGLNETRRLLLHTGFEVLDGRNQALDARRPGLKGLLGAAARAVLPLHWFSGTLCFAARKVTCF